MYHPYHFDTLLAHLLGHFLGRTSYDITVKHDKQPFLMLVQALEKKEKTQLPLRIGMSTFAK